MKTHRASPIEIRKEEFKKIGHQLIDDIAEFMDTIGERSVTPVISKASQRNFISSSALPENGTSVDEILSNATDLVINHSLHNGHPRFLGYITSSAAPLGALADMLAASVNPNVGAQILSPVATAIEKQTVRWLAEFIGVSSSYGGILVSGGNMANFTAFLTARTAKTPKRFKKTGLSKLRSKLLVYCSTATHTWIEKAAVLFGHGTDAIRWIKTDSSNKLDQKALQRAIEKDLKAGHHPFMVVGTAGDVSTGVVDNLSEIGGLCKTYDLWFHIDGAYGMPAAVVPELKSLFQGVEAADSIAIDPHKWLYSPLEAGCTLVKNAQHLQETFSSHPVYYNFSNVNDEQALNYYEYGLQNSRGFRALKVWLVLQQVGRSGYIEMIREDIEMAELLFKLANEHAELEAVSQNLSIATLRYVPLDVSRGKKREAYLNALNEKLLNDLQASGELFVSNAVVSGKYCLRGCVVNFRTSSQDIKEMIKIIVRRGRKVHRMLQAER